MNYWVYIVRCARGTFYTGITNNLAARIAAHNCGKGAKYLRGRTPVKLVYAQKSSDINHALREERRIKSLTRAQKNSLILKKTGVSQVPGT